MSGTVFHRPAPRSALALGLAATLVLCVLSSASSALAGSFYEDGTFAFDPQAVDSFDFEDGVPDPLDPMDDPMVRVESETALSGKWIIEVEQFGSAAVAIDFPAQRRTYRASLWARGGETTAFISVVHGDSTRNDELVVLYPTGRVTSDGWVELGNNGLRIDGARSTMVMGVFCPGTCEMDALEVAIEDAIAGPVNTPCAGTADANACGVGQICMWSECRNVNGWVPPIPADRDTVSEYLENRLRFLFGPFLERTIDMPSMLSSLDGMRKATDPWGYWNSFMVGVRRLHDGHTSASYSFPSFSLGQSNPKPVHACFVEGAADLSQGTAPSDPLYNDILVSHVGPDHNLGLKAGDRLVRIDGQHPIAWARTLIQIHSGYRTASNHRTFAEITSGLRGSISRYAHEIEVIRCDAQNVSCGALETISISDIPFDDETTVSTFVACDNRPLRHVPGAPVSHSGGFGEVFAGLLNESNTTEKIYGVEWESLYTTTGNDGVGANLKAAIQLLNTDGARGVIFDHRTGNGGTLGGPRPIWDFAVQAHPITFMQTRQRALDEQPPLALGVSIFNGAVANGDADWAGSNNPTTIPVALLLTEDVSASDWLPLGMKNAGPNVRIFGPYETNGAFSTLYSLGYWLGLDYVMASADSFIADGSTHNGTGVTPDVLVMPLQSDLVVGTDTVFEAALAWVRQELP